MYNNIKLRIPAIKFLVNLQLKIQHKMTYFHKVFQFHTVAYSDRKASDLQLFY